MRQKLALPLLAVFVFVSPGPAQSAKKSDAVVKVKAKAAKPAADGTQVITVTLTIDSGYHLYANPVGLEDLKSVQTSVTISGADKPKTEKTEYPKGKEVKDPIVGDHFVYEKTVDIKATIKRSPGAQGALEAEIRLNACTDKSCLPPATVKVTVEQP